MNIIPQKRCTKCGVEKPLTDFKKGKGYAGGLRPQCRECLIIARRELRKKPGYRDHENEMRRKNRDRPEVKARERAYMQRPDVNERVKERERKRWANDPKLREYKRNYLRKRYQENADHKQKQIGYSMRAIHARRARKQRQGGAYSAKEWRDLCAKYGHVCLCCGKAERLTPDHVVPIAKGGSNDISNIQPLCLPCNLRKATKIIDYRPN